MLKGLFSCDTKIKVLELLVFNPDKQFYLREIARLVKSEPIYVRNQLQKLADCGLVEFERKGKLSLYKINESSPILGDLRGIFLKTTMLGSYLKGKVNGFDLRFALVYGSFAQGRENEKSDVDLLLVGKANEKSLATVISGCEGKIGREINYILWTIDDFNERVKNNSPLLRDIAKSHLIMLVGAESEFRELAGKGVAEES